MGMYGYSMIQMKRKKETNNDTKIKAGGFIIQDNAAQETRSNEGCITLISNIL